MDTERLEYRFAVFLRYCYSVLVISALSLHYHQPLRGSTASHHRPSLALTRLASLWNQRLDHSLDKSTPLCRTTLDMATSSQQPSARSKLKTTFGSLRHRPAPAPVPAGTVASRVSYLQSLAASATNRASSTRRSPSSPKARNTVKSKRPLNDDFRFDDDRGDFGR